MKDFWLDRWQTNDIPWQQAEPEPLLVRYISKEKKQNILVPLCGKSTDMLWLKNQGHKVVGIELSPIAAQSFFEDAKINFTRRNQGSYEFFQGENVEIWCGDFFEFGPENIPELDLIYDRAASIALPEKMRKNYSESIVRIANARASKNFQILMILREGIGADQEGPPFNVPEAEVNSNYGETFKIELLESALRVSNADPNAKVSEKAYRLRLKTQKQRH